MNVALKLTTVTQMQFVQTLQAVSSARANQAILVLEQAVKMSMNAAQGRTPATRTRYALIQPAASLALAILATKGREQIVQKTTVGAGTTATSTPFAKICQGRTVFRACVHRDSRQWAVVARDHPAHAQPTR
jgi:hypothetical protein